MARSKRFDYKHAAEQLRKYGYAPKFGSRKKGANSAQAKAAVKKQWEKIRLFVVPGKSGRVLKYRFKFVKTNSAEKVKAMEGMNPKVRTPKGFFVRIPTGVKSYRIKFNKGELRVDVVGKRGGKRTEKIYPLNASRLAKDPEKEIRKVTRKPGVEPIEGRLVVNGFDSHSFDQDTFGDFEQYLVDFFYESQDPSLKKPGPGFHGKEPITPEQFTEIFHVKIISQTPSHNGPKKAGTKNKRKKRKTGKENHSPKARKSPKTKAVRKR